MGVAQAAAHRRRGALAAAASGCARKRSATAGEMPTTRSGKAGSVATISSRAAPGIASNGWAFLGAVQLAALPGATFGSMSWTCSGVAERLMPCGGRPSAKAMCSAVALSPEALARRIRSLCEAAPRALVASPASSRCAAADGVAADDGRFMVTARRP